MRTRYLPVALAIILVDLSVIAFGADNGQPASQRQTITLSLGVESMTQLVSQRPDYFGTHYAGTPEGVGRWWNTVRSYGGAHTVVYATDNSPLHVGPFPGRKVRVGQVAVPTCLWHLLVWWRQNTARRWSCLQRRARSSAKLHNIKWVVTSRASDQSAITAPSWASAAPSASLRASSDQP
jgi:hypothetical protein